MKRKISLALILTMLINLIGVFGAIMPMQTALAETRTLKVLCIGSSFGVNSTQYLYQLAADCGATDIIIGNAWRTACTIDVHWQQASGNLPGYEYKKNTTGTWTVKQNQTMLSAIQDEDWDVIAFQQSAEKAAEAGSYAANLDNVANYINSNKTNPNAKIAWNAVWSFRGDSCTAYYNDQETMYYYIVNAVKQYVVPNPIISMILPSGTAIQNARSSFIGDKFNVDSMHLNNLGCYTAGMAWIKKITGWSIDDITYAPSGVTADQIVAVKDAVNKAVATPLKKTASGYPPTPDPSATATPEPIATPTPGPDGRIVIPLIKDNFEKYADTTDLTNAGWVVGGTVAPTFKIGSTPQNHQSVSVPGAGSLSKTFAPVPLNAMGGKSPGKNAKIVFSFDGYMSSSTGANSAYFRLCDAATGYNAVSIGRRGSGVMKYSDSIASGSTDLTVSASLPKFTKVKFVVKLTDQNGEFTDVAHTKADVYVNDMNTPVAGGADVKMIDTYTKTASRFYMGGVMSTEIDNLDVSLVVDSDNMPVETPTATPTQYTSLFDKILEAQNLFDLANAHIGVGPGQYAPELVSALSAAIAEATAVYNNPNTTQAEADAQVPLLQAAIIGCVHLPTAVPTPTPVPTATPEPTATPITTVTPTPFATVIVDNTDAGCTFDAPWTASTTTTGYYGSNYMHDGTTTADTADRWAKWTPSITQAGTYNIYMRWTTGTNRPNAAPLEIQYNGNIDTTKTVNQQNNNGTWVLIGAYDLAVGTNNYVKILATNAGNTIADAVKFECITAATATPTPPVIRTDLEKMLFEASSVYNYAKEIIGYNPGQFTPEVVAALNAAMISGQAVYENANATQAEVDSAVAALISTKAACVENTATPTPTIEPTTPPPTAAPSTIPAANIVINGGGTITNPYGKVDASIVRVDVTGIINPTTDTKVVMIKGVPAKYTYYNGLYKFVALVDSSVIASDVTIADGTSTQLLYADLNLNLSTDATDVNLLKGAVAGNRIAASNFELLASDVNGDGVVNATDYNTLKGFIAGNLAILPVYSK